LANQLDRAASAIDVALAEAASPAVVALARAWLAQLRNRQKEPGEAARHAAAALAERLPLERATTEALLRILVDAARPELAEEAAEALVAMHRELVDRDIDSPAALRDLSLSLNNVADIQHARGQLDDALTAAVEARDVYGILAAAYPEVAGDAEQDGLERAVTRLTGPAPAG
jgi:hypothetical protein